MGLATRRWIRARSYLLPISALASVWSCADLLDLSVALPPPSFCRYDEECPRDWSCTHGLCVSRLCSEPSSKQCAGLTLLGCGMDGKWHDSVKCQSKCENDKCVDAPSCDFGEHCADERSCCDAIQIEPATFELSYAVSVRFGGERDDSLKRVSRTLRPYALDRFEVTVRRFYAFVGDYDAARQPAPGAGKHPAFPDSGWQQAWNGINGVLPTTTGSLLQQLQAHGEALDLTMSTLPVRGVDWYLANAFCIWDGGRLPSEAEWAYAATGGDDREYPWPSDVDPTITHEHAVYSDASEPQPGPEPVGTHSAGQGPFGHEDLAGNVTEWVADSYGEILPATCARDGDNSLDEHECMQ